MNRSALSLVQRLDVELAEKTPAASAAFFIAAIIFCFADFEGLPRIATQISAILIMILNIGRMTLARMALSQETYHPRLFFAIKTTIFLNGFCWGIIFLPLNEQMETAGLDSGFLLLAMTAMTASSVITLPASLTLALSFQLFILLPTVTKSWLSYVQNDAGNRITFSVMVTVFMLYLMKQTMDSRKQLIRSFTHEINLENSLQDLRKSNERIVEETAKSQHASRLAAIGEIAGGIAHEINNPLTVVLSSIEHLENIYQDDKDLFHKNFLLKTNRSKTAIERINRIIRGLRVFSQQSDRQPKKWVSMKQIIDDTIEFCGEKMAHNGIAYTISLHNPDAKILCNPVQISQVLLNLVNNSIYALAKDETLTERWVKIETLERGGMIVVNVTDSGRGISAEHQKKLFQPFFTTKELGQGTGLGLSISQSILREHGGDLRYDPQSLNTRFTFQLPLDGK